MITNITKADFKVGSKINLSKAKGVGALVIVKADWCTFCKRLLVDLKKVSKKLGDAYPIMLIDADTQKEMVNVLEVEGFPTIFFFDRNGDLSKKYSGDRSEGGILSAICSESLVCRK
jgi:thiol-disulfide isomerase/thioredoxin